MAEIHMQLADALHFGRALSTQAKEIRKQLNEYIDGMPLPEGSTGLQRANLKMWMNHYMDGVCSFESLNNLLNQWGLATLLKMPPHEMEVDADGKLTVYEVVERNE